MYVDIYVDDTQAQEFFDYAGYRSRDLREPLKDVLHSVVLRGIAEQFATQGGRSGGWAPLSDSYMMRKPPGLPILMLTGQMAEYLMLGDMPGGPARVTREELRYHPTMDRVSWLHWGAYNGRGYLPPRHIIEWTNEDDAATEEIFASWLDDVMHANTRRYGGSRPDTLPIIAGIF